MFQTGQLHWLLCRSMFPTTSKLLIAMCANGMCGEGDDKDNLEDLDYRDDLDKERANIFLGDNSFETFKLAGGLALFRGREKFLTKLMHEYAHIILQLTTMFKVRFADILENSLLKAFSVIQNTMGYQYVGVRELMANVNVISSFYRKTLRANRCDIANLEEELIVIKQHVGRFLPNTKPSASIPQLFLKQDSIGISNIMHLFELGLVQPIGNAESERSFSYVTDSMTKKRNRLSVECVGDCLVCLSVPYQSTVVFERAVNMFLQVKPRRLVGRACTTHYKKKKRKLPIEFEDIYLESYQRKINALTPDDISSHEGVWSDMDNEYNE